MKEILFRGKCLKDGNWHYGSYIKTNIDVPSIVFGDGEQIEVDPETIGQFTGRKDSIGKKIFEGMRVSYHEFKEGYTDSTAQDGWGRTVQLCRHGQEYVPPEEKTTIGTVVYSEGRSCFRIKFDERLLSGGDGDDLYMYGDYPSRLKNKLLIQ